MKGSKNDKGIQVRRKIKAFFYALRYAVKHAYRYSKSVNYDYYKSEENFLPILIANYHVIEKCLAMPNFELGHAKERVGVVCMDLIKYSELGFDTQNPQFVAAIQAVEEYNDVHKKASFALPVDLQAAIDNAISLKKVEKHEQPLVSNDSFYGKLYGTFEDFAKSRHSVRTYSDKEIELDVLKDCVDIARTTPTACNRQPNKTYIITQKELIKKIVNVQGGGRGFAENANKILIVTSSVSVFNNNEVFEALKSGGMYAMNLLYALHSKKIGVCPLLWGEDIKKDNYLRKLINIPDNEEIIIIYSCGYPTSEFKYVTSVRNDLEKSMVVV